jgi:hypothetical protein
MSTKIKLLEWFNHFKSLFNDFTGVSENEEEEVFYDANDNPGPLTFENDITEQEILTAIRSLKLSKAAGPDAMIPEFFKFAALHMMPFLAKLFNKLYATGTYPKTWSEAIIHPIHKKGDIDVPDNYRGISLLNIISKIYSRILNKRLIDWLVQNNKIHESQAGFRKGYCTVDHIFTLSAIVNKKLSYHKRLYVAFIDFRKAFDSVIRTKLWNIVRKNGINGKMYRALVSMYDIVKARVRANGDMSDSFDCPRGVKQGEVCSPILFTMLINEIAKDIVDKGRHGIQLLPDIVQILILMFADDIILMSDSVVGLQNQLNVLRNTALQLGLSVNLSKSNIVVFRNGGHLAANEKWFYEGHRLEVVNAYKYLGIIVSTRLTYSHALKDMANRARIGTINILKLLWRLGEQSPHVFFKLFDTQIQPMLSYGAEVWGMEADLTVLERVHLFALKRFLNVSVRTPNTLVYGETGRYPLRININIKCVKYWLKLQEMSTDRYPKKAYNMLLHMQQDNRQTWASSIQYCLYKFGFQEVWLNRGVGNEKAFLQLFRERQIDAFKRQWKFELETKERFKFYSGIKADFSLSLFLANLKHVKSRIDLIRFRLGVSQIKIHKLRFSRANNIDFTCPFCNAIENEIHFLLVCPMYEDLREFYIPTKYYRSPCLFKLAVLLATTNKMLQIRIARFLAESFRRRASLLSELSM